jgi:branched-subunit amino acid ABC-type transport system permease component
LNGLVYGMLLFMLASGLTLIFSMMGVLNFAHASAYMLGAYFAYTLSLYVGFWWALLFAPVLCGLFGAGIEMYGLRRVHKNGHVAELLFTFGLALIIEKCVQMTGGCCLCPTDSGRAGLRAVRHLRHTVPRVPGIHAGDFCRDVRCDLAGADPYAGRADHPGVAHASRDGPFARA